MKLAVVAIVFLLSGCATAREMTVIETDQGMKDCMAKHLLPRFVRDKRHKVIAVKCICSPLEPLINTRVIAADLMQGGYNSSVMCWDEGEHKGCDVGCGFHGAGALVLGITCRKAGFRWWMGAQWSWRRGCLPHLGLRSHCDARLRSARG